MDKNVADFWERLELAQLKANKITLQNLCKSLGIPYQTIINQKCQNRYPSVTTLLKFADALHTSVDWLLVGTEKTTTARLETLVAKLKTATTDQINAMEILLSN